MNIKLEKRRYLLAAIANALQTASESISLVRDAADEKEPFEKSLDYLWTAVGELKRHAADNTAEANQAATVWLLDVIGFITDVMIDAEVVRSVDACIVNILDSECIEVLRLIREFRRSVEVTEAFLTVNQLLSLLATDNCQIDFYDSTHQIEEMLTERNLREGKNKFNWMDAKVEYFSIVGVDDINICCLLKEAEV